jgi:hypothetical protein
MKQQMTTFRSIRRRAVVGSMLPAAIIASACASTGATLNSGVGDAFPVHPPYYAGVSRVAVAADSSRIGFLPIVFQRGASQNAIFDPSSAPGTPTAALLAEMTAYLDTLSSGGGSFVRLSGAEASTSGEALVPPDVRFGCLTVTGTSDGDCEVRGDGGALGRGHQELKLAVGRPSAAWVVRTRESMTRARVTRVLVVTLEVGQVLLRQTGLRGNKELELGTGHTAKLPWLTSLETPVAVLQLTGALVDSNGKAIRIGAEAFQAKRTSFAASSVGAQALLHDEDVAEARTRRRDDLPGKPLAWRIALEHLVSQLTGRGPAAS